MSFMKWRDTALMVLLLQEQGNSADGAESLIGLSLFQFMNLLYVLGNAARKSRFKAT